MRIDVVTLFPGMFDSLTEFGVVGRAIRGGLVELGLWNPRDYTKDRNRTVDDRPYGGGPGMVMQYQPLSDTIKAARSAAEARSTESEGARVVYLTPQGRRLDQAAVRQMVNGRPLVLVAGRYEGIDERVIAAEVDEEWSIGDYVLSGGEIAAMVVIDALVRLVPEVLGHDDSAEQDSFSDGLLDYPHYTRPEEAGGLRVPEVLIGGDHAAVRRWRLKQALGRTWQRRPDLLEQVQLDAEQSGLLDEFIKEYKA